MGKKESRSTYRCVDMWALPGMNPRNLELLQKLKTADTNHFTKHMDIVGTVSQKEMETGKWDKTHLVGLRTDVWKADAKELARAVESVRAKRKQELKKSIKKHGRLNQKQEEALNQQLADDDIMQMQSGEIEKRRLVLKLFRTTATRTRWCGTVEQLTTTEIHHSIGSRRNLLTLAVMLPGHDHVVRVQQVHRTFRVPSVFTFGFFQNGRMWNVLLKRHWFSIGADFDVEVDGGKVGEIDGTLFSFGSDSYVDLREHELANCTPFIDLLTLFAATSGYHRAMRRSVDRRVSAALEGKSFRHLIEDEELRLRHNGRAAA